MKKPGEGTSDPGGAVSLRGEGALDQILSTSELSFTVDLNESVLEIEAGETEVQGRPFQKTAQCVSMSRFGGMPEPYCLSTTRSHLADRAR